MTNNGTLSYHLKDGDLLAAPDRHRLGACRHAADDNVRVGKVGLGAVHLDGEARRGDLHRGTATLIGGGLHLQAQGTSHGKR